MELGDALGQHSVVGYANACAARVEAACGFESECRDHVARSRELTERTGALTGRAYTGSTVGLLELGLGHIDAAVAALVPVEDYTRASGLLDPTVIQWAPDLVEAYVRAGRPDAALFVTPKTIEFHLGHIYRKLGVHSRTRLAVLLAREATKRDGVLDAVTIASAGTPAPD